MIKISIVLLIVRIFCPQERDPFYWIMQLITLLNTIFYTIFFFIVIFNCSPRQKIWLPKTPGKCLGLTPIYIASSAFNSCSDIAMYSAPIWKLFQLQNLSMGRKLGISAIFATGFV